MPKTKISEFSATPGNNTDIDGINIAEGCAPSGINDAIRELMSQLKDFQAGTAGDSFNGPVGTTTAAAGAFTTLSASGNITVSGGTANGVAYLNGSKVLTTGSALTFDGSQLAVNAASGGVNMVVSSSGNTGLRVVGGTGSGLGSYLSLQAQGTNAALVATEGSVVGGTSNNLMLYGYGSNSIIMAPATAEVARFTSTGLGIGTSSPGSLLHIKGSSNPAIYWENSTFGTAKNAVFMSSSGQLVFGRAGVTDWMTLDSSGNLGLGVTPSAWGIGKALQVNNASLMGYLNRLYANANTYFDGTGTGKYIASDYATSYQQLNGTHAWFTAPSGTAGNAISFTQAMTLDASGNLVLGTTAAASARLYVRGSGTTSATASFEAANSSGATRLYVQDDGTTRFFGSAGSETARITSGGNLLVGKTSFGGTATGIDLGANGFVGSYSPDTTNATSTFAAYSNGASAYRFYVGWGGTVYATSTTITAISDRRLKENIQDIDVGLDAVMALKPRKFDWKAGKGKDKKGDRGWIAQEFEQVFPEMIDTWRDPAPEGEEPYKAVNADLIPVLVKAIQEQQAIITDLRARVAQLEAK